MLQLYYKKLNESVKGILDEKRRMTISDESGKSEKLPVATKDKNGDKVELVYKKYQTVMIFK